jgi:hypothetical protein
MEKSTSFIISFIVSFFS